MGPATPLSSPASVHPARRGPAWGLRVRIMTARALRRRPTSRPPAAGCLDADGQAAPRLNALELDALPAAQAAAEGGTAVADQKRPLFPSLAVLLAGHILRDGEVVLLILKPSLWYILFSAMRMSAAVLIGVIAAELWLPERAAEWYVAAGTFLIAARFMWSVLNWMGRLYVLTDMRVLRLSGVFAVEVFDCPLRQVATTRLTYSFRERLWRLGSIEIVPKDEARPAGVWQTVRRPANVHERVEAAVAKAKSSR